MTNHHDDVACRSYKHLEARAWYQRATFAVRRKDTKFPNLRWLLLEHPGSAAAVLAYDAVAVFDDDMMVI